MKDIISKAEVLIEALPYIQEFRGDVVVVKIGGSTMEDESHMEGILTDVTFMECVGMLPVVVHGGGKAISRGMEEHGIETSFVKGLRVTCEKSIEIVERVLNHEVNPRVVSVLRGLGAKAEGIGGQDIFHVVKKTEVDEETGEVIDWGLVGDPGEVETGPVTALLRKETVPVITPLGRGQDGKIHNINADAAAAAVARGLRARKLALVSDVPGLLRDPGDETSVITTLKAGEAEEMIGLGAIDGGMIPKVEGGLRALQAGVSKIHIIDGRMTHSLLLEIFTDKGVGTEIVAD